MEKILVNGAISVFLLMLIIFGNFLGELMPCRVQTHLKNKFANHYFANNEDVLLAFEQQKIGLHTPIWLKNNNLTK